MKNCIKIIWLALFCFPLMSMAQESNLDEFFEKYHGEKDVSSISISMDAFQISLADDTDNELENLIDQVEKVQILHFKNRYKTFRDSDFKNDIMEILNKDDYKLLIDVIEEDETIKIYIVSGERNQITEGLIMTQEDDEASLIWVTGNMKLSDFMHSHKHFRKYH